MPGKRWIQAALLITTFCANEIASAQASSPEITFDPTTATVRVVLSVDDIPQLSIPHVRPNDFAIFEDGRRQEDASIDVEHSSLTLAVLVEMGGRSAQLNRVLAVDGGYTARPLLDVLRPDDRFALFAYTDRLHTIVDFDASVDKRREAVARLSEPQFSEVTLYDAASQVIGRLASMSGRRGLLLISTGIDTVSHRTFDDLLKAAESAKIPIYVIDLGEAARRKATAIAGGPLSRVDWAECTRRLQALASATGGQWYARDAAIDPAAIYDDMMEELRVHYVITYASTQRSADAMPRTVHVELADHGARTPRKHDGSPDRDATTRVIANASYIPAMASSRVAPLVTDTTAYEPVMTAGSEQLVTTKPAGILDAGRTAGGVP